MVASLRYSDTFVKIDGTIIQGLSADPQLQMKVRALVEAARRRNIRTIGERVEISGGSPFGPGRQSRTPQAQLATGFGPPFTSTRHIRQLPAIDSRSW